MEGGLRTTNPPMECPTTVTGMSASSNRWSRDCTCPTYMSTSYRQSSGLSEKPRPKMSKRSVRYPAAFMAFAMHSKR